jgi:DNA polymerase-3 subunit beta
MTKQIKIHQTHLNKALQICSKALDTNNILPINSMFLFDISPGRLSISACNMSMSITTDCEVESDISGRICIPGTKLASYVAKCNPELLGFEISETKCAVKGIVQSLTIKSKSGKCTLPLEPGEDFPVIKNTATANLTIPAAEFLSVLTKTIFAISDDQLRPSATGLHIQATEGKITYTSLNFNQVCTYTFDAPGLPDLQIILPKKSLQILQSLNPAGTLNIAIGESIQLDFNGISTRSRLIDEKYPDYKSVIPKDNDIEFLTSRSELLSALKRVMPFCDYGKLIKLNISAETISIIAENIDFAEEAKEDIAGVLTGGDILFGANADYLLNMLISFTSDKLYLSFKTNKTNMLATDGERVNPAELTNMVLIAPMTV